MDPVFAKRARLSRAATHWLDRLLRRLFLLLCDDDSTGGVEWNPRGRQK